MSTPPDHPQIYHITHVDNLAGIVADRRLVSDREILARGGPRQVIGMSEIKRRRIEELEVGCHQGTKVGDYVPFYFCPRSLMLYLLHRANHPDLTYHGGQEPIAHLEADLHEVIQWAEDNDRRWAFSLSNAGAYYATIRAHVAQLDQVDWTAVAAHDFSTSKVKEGKQAEFLIHERFPFSLVRRIGVRSSATRDRVIEVVRAGSHRPPVEVVPEWYF